MAPEGKPCVYHVANLHRPPLHISSPQRLWAPPPLCRVHPRPPPPPMPCCAAAAPRPDSLAGEAAPARRLAGAAGALLRNDALLSAQDTCTRAHTRAHKPPQAALLAGIQVRGRPLPARPRAKVFLLPGPPARGHACWYYIHTCTHVQRTPHRCTAVPRILPPRFASQPSSQAR